jgi:hypothetical protein
VVEGSYAMVARMLDKLANVPVVRGAFDEYVSG